MLKGSDSIVYLCIKYATWKVSKLLTTQILSITCKLIT